MSPFRITILVLVGVGLLAASTAQADPLAQQVESALALPIPHAPSYFGYAGTRPLDPTTASGITRPTPAPCIEASGFGFAGPRPLPRFRPDVVPATAPYVDCGACTECPQPTLTIDGRCDTGCTTCCPPPATRRIATTALSVPTTFWSSGYHDGNNDRVSCAPTTTCSPTPCATTTTCAPRRVVYRSAYGGPCGPRPYAYGGYGYRYGGGYGYGYGCGPRYGYGWAPAAAAAGLGLALTLPFLAFGCW